MSSTPPPNEWIELLHNAPEGLYVMMPLPASPFMHFVMWNHQMTMITGYTQKEINDIGWHVTLIKTDASITFAPEDPSYEATIITKNGETKTLSIALNTLTQNDIIYTIACVRDISAFKRYEAMLLEQAKIDPLTNIANRRSIIEHIHYTLAYASRTKKNFCLLMLDLDYFKNVNDTYGHAIGDIVLCQTVALIRDTLRPYDEIGRLSGEEFIVTLPDTNLKTAGTIAERICVAMRKHTFYSEKDKAFSVTVSIGGTEYISGDTDETIIKRSDDNLYKAKRTGRNRVIME